MNLFDNDRCDNIRWIKYSVSTTKKKIWSGKCKDKFMTTRRHSNARERASFNGSAREHCIPENLMLNNNLSDGLLLRSWRELTHALGVAYYSPKSAIVDFYPFAKPDPYQNSSQNRFFVGKYALVSIGPVDKHSSAHASSLSMLISWLFRQQILDMTHVWSHIWLYISPYMESYINSYIPIFWVIYVSIYGVIYDLIYPHIWSHVWPYKSP